MTTGYTILQPERIEEAVALLAEGDEDVRLLGGGTGLTLLIRYGFFAPETLVSLQRIAPDHRSIEMLPDGRTRIGGMTTLRDLEDHRELLRRYTLLAEALERLASIRIRNVAQIGGAIAHGHPQMDVPPVLLALGAEVEVRSARGTRTIPADDLFVGYYETAVRRDEIITAVLLPPVDDLRTCYRKVTARLHDDWPALGVAVAARVTSGVISEARVALGAIADRPQRVAAAEQALIGARVDEIDLQDVARSAAGTLEYHDGSAGSAAYQHRLVSVHLERALTAVVGGDARTEVQ
jgi:aerobic carbon-monoxide dehydrogenase medium subunit